MAKKRPKKADTFASHLNKVFKSNPSKISTKDEKFIYDFLNDTHESVISLNSFTTYKIQKTFEFLKSKKYPTS